MLRSSNNLYIYLLKYMHRKIQHEKKRREKGFDTKKFIIM